MIRKPQMPAMRKTTFANFMRHILTWASGAIKTCTFLAVARLYFARSSYSEQLTHACFATSFRGCTVRHAGCHVGFGGLRQSRARRAAVQRLVLARTQRPAARRPRIAATFNRSKRRAADANQHFLQDPDGIRARRRPASARQGGDG